MTAIACTSETALEVTTEAAAAPAPIRTFDVLLHRLDYVTDALAKLGKRAVKKGLTPVKFTVGKAFTRREHNALFPCTPGSCTGCRNVDRIPLTLEGDAPHYEGWTFAAALEHLDGENIVRSLPGEVLPTTYRTRGPVCDHCQARRGRRATYVVRHTDGRTMQVGSTCLGDFLGTDAADMLVLSATYMADVAELLEDDGESHGGGHESGGLLSAYLPIVAWCVDVQGWRSRKVAREYDKPATADLARMYQNDRRAAEDAGVKITEAHVELAVAAEAWAEGLTDAQVDAETGDYLHNLRAVARMGMVTGKTMGIAASIITAYQRAMGAERKRAAFALRPPSAHVGTVGKRETFRVTLDFVTGYETAYGYTTILKFLRADGAVLVWKASSTSLTREDVGKVFDVKGTVKKHDMYKDTAQTMLTRCAVTSVEEVAA